jgi:hypothetical protein
MTNGAHVESRDGRIVLTVRQPHTIHSTITAAVVLTADEARALADELLALMRAGR